MRLARSLRRIVPLLLKVVRSAFWPVRSRGDPSAIHGSSRFGADGRTADRFLVRGRQILADLPLGEPRQDCSRHEQRPSSRPRIRTFAEHFGFDMQRFSARSVTTREAPGPKAQARSPNKRPRTFSCGPAVRGSEKASRPTSRCLLETLWSKRRILETYLNIVEFGDGIYGVEAAAQHYFRKPASRLNSEEAALLAAVLPNPDVQGEVTRALRARTPAVDPAADAPARREQPGQEVRVVRTAYGFRAR